MAARTSAAVIGALGSGETPFGPAVGRAVDIEQGVLLLDAKPGDLVRGGIHGLLRIVTVVGLVRRPVVVVTLGENEDVVAAAERVLEDGGGAEVDVRVATRRLVRRRAVEIPDAQRADVGHLLAHGLESGE